MDVTNAATPISRDRKKHHPVQAAVLSSYALHYSVMHALMHCAANVSSSSRQSQTTSLLGHQSGVQNHVSPFLLKSATVRPLQDIEGYVDALGSFLSK